MTSSTPYLGNAVQQAKAAKDKLFEKVSSLIEEERAKAIEKADSLLADITSRKSFAKLDASQQQITLSKLQQKKKSFREVRFIGNIREGVNQMSDLHTDALNKMVEFLTPKEKDGDGPTTNEPQTKYQRKDNIYVTFSKKELQTEEDVLSYLEALKKAYIDRINKNIRITL